VWATYRHYWVNTSELAAGLPLPRSFSQDHPFAQLKGSDNIIVFETERYEAAMLHT